MKSKIATVLLTIASATGFCEDALTNSSAINLPIELKLNEKALPKHSFSYVRLGLGDKDAVNTFETVPGLGLGYRYAMENSAIDMSANYTSQISGSKIRDTYFYTVPKVTYLRYVSADVAAQSIYYGAGLAWGGVKKGADLASFQGFIPNATVGYEMNRNQTFHSFVQLDVSQPVASVSRANDNFISFANLPGPLAEVSVGLGF
jgi:hypothetical protein